jgi:hypothetical protein
VADPAGAKLTEDPVKENDHAMDALSYLCAGIARLHGEDVPVRTGRSRSPAHPETPAAGGFGELNWRQLDNPNFWGGRNHSDP